MSKKLENSPLLHKQGSKHYNIHNLRPYVKLTKKQYKNTSRNNYIFALEYKKKLYRQNILNNLVYNNFMQNRFAIQTLYNKSIYKKDKYYFNNYYEIPFSSIQKYHSVLNGFSLWAIQKQTTALRVFPQSSALWLSSLNTLETDLSKPLDTICDKNTNRKNKLWTAGFVRVRKLRQYYSRQLQSTEKLLYWYNYASVTKIQKIINKVYTHNKGTNHVIWNIICFLDSLWTNILLKSNFVYNTSASLNSMKQNTIIRNGVFLKNPTTLCKPGDIFQKDK
jgi:hypothetical protein